MYKTTYEVIARDNSINNRRIERDALIKVIADMKSAYKTDVVNIDVIKACALMQQIWTIMLSEVMNDDNGLPIELRASIISIGIWIQKELTLIIAGESKNINGIIEINQIIADGLI